MKAIKEVSGVCEEIIILEHHGRTAANTDVSRTTGWFTALFPVALELNGNTIGEEIIAIKEQIKSIPSNGIGYGLQHCFNAENTPALSQPGIRFNYLGEFGFSDFSDLFVISDKETGADSAETNHVTAAIDVECMIREGKLKIVFYYNGQAENKKEGERMAISYKAQLELLLAYLKEEERMLFSPSDFETANLNQEDLNSLFN
jgi:non-ribosomal peptide synthase protein (TIGR01720 family)